MADIAQVKVISLPWLEQQVLPGVQRTEAKLSADIDSLGDSPSTMDLMLMQQKVTQWTIGVQTYSTLVKELGDAAKGVISKIQ